MRTVVLAALLALLTACGGGDSSESVPFTTLAKTFYSEVEQREGVVARNPAEFNAVWARFTGHLTEPPPAPAVDFDVNQVVGFFLGVSSGCHDASIVGVTRLSDRLVVTYKELLPPDDPDVGCIASSVYPGHLVLVPQSPLRVEFKSE